MDKSNPDVKQMASVFSFVQMSLYDRITKIGEHVQQGKLTGATTSQRKRHLKEINESLKFMQYQLDSLDDFMRRGWQELPPEYLALRDMLKSWIAGRVNARDVFKKKFKL